MLNSNFVINDLNSEIDNKLLSTLIFVSEKLSALGVSVHPYSNASLAKLSELDVDRKFKIIDYYKNWIHLHSRESDIANTFDNTEVEFAKKSLKHYGFKVNDDFWKTVEHDHVIEIYGTDMVQLYRSFNFFKYSGYSLLDIAVFEWFSLWERPKAVTEMLFSNIEYVVSHCAPLHKVTAPPHLLREIMNTGETLNFTPRACHMEFKYISALTNEYNQCSGFICSAVGSVIARGEDVHKLGLV